MNNNPDHQLPDSLLELESELHELVPSSIPGELFVRLEKSMVRCTDRGVTAVHSLEELEIHLGQMAPAGMHPDLIERMVRAMDDWQRQLPVDEKLVAFAGGARGKRPRRVSYGMGMMAMAAAVALLGAICALVLPDLLQKGGPAVAANTTPETVGQVVNPAGPDTAGVPLLAATVPAAAPVTARLVEESVAHRITSTSDEGLVISGDDIPHRCIRVEYVDHVTVEGQNGQRVEVRRPGVKYVLFPVEVY